MYGRIVTLIWFQQAEWENRLYYSLPSFRCQQKTMGANYKCDRRAQNRYLGNGTSNVIRCSANTWMKWQDILTVEDISPFFFRHFREFSKFARQNYTLASNKIRQVNKKLEKVSDVYQIFKNLTFFYLAYKLDNNFNNLI